LRFFRQEPGKCRGCPIMGAAMNVFHAPVRPRLQERRLKPARPADDCRSPYTDDDRHRLECIGLLRSGVAHDMANILTVLSGFCHVALNENVSPEQRSHRLKGGSQRRSGHRVVLANHIVQPPQHRERALFDFNQVSRNWRAHSATSGRCGGGDGVCQRPLMFWPTDRAHSNRPQHRS